MKALLGGQLGVGYFFSHGASTQVTVISVGCSSFISFCS